MPDMDGYAPFDTGNGSAVTESMWRSFMRRMVTSGVTRDIDNELRVFGDSTGMQVKIDTGEVLLEGHWGRISSQKILSISSAHPTLPRRDLVVARANFVTDKVEYDKLTGVPASTPLVPTPTQSASIWEIPLAIVRVNAGVSTIASGDVSLARQWGGMVAPTVMDDFLLFDDKISSCQRAQVNGDAPVNAGNAYFTRLQALKTVTVSKFRIFTTVARVNGSTTARIFYGPSQSELKNFVDPVNYNFGLTGLSEGTFTPITLTAGTVVVVYVRSTSAVTTAPQMAAIDASAGITGGASNLLNPSTTSNMTCGFKTESSTPSTLNIIDGTWTKRDRYFWCALG